MSEESLEQLEIFFLNKINQFRAELGCFPISKGREKTSRRKPSRARQNSGYIDDSIWRGIYIFISNGQSLESRSGHRS